MNDKTIHLIGNAHLDPIWLWRWQEGCGEVLQTFRSALDRLNEYDDFVFTCSSAAYYKWVEEIDPDMFAEIKKMIKKGRWVPVNGWWVQPDCNMPSSESFARQALYSQLYYYEKFGRICRTGYNVDSFGHNAMIPQLVKQGGMDFYVMMRPDSRENPDVPSSLFWWDSPDGSRVLTYRIPTGYAENGTDSIDRAIDIMTDFAEKEDHGMMLFYGVGNHGGGPTKGDIEYLSSKSDEGVPVEFSSPDDFFESVCSQKLDIPTWRDELQHHASGCYSATSLVKQLNRKCENALQNAEKWNTVASKIYSLPAGTVDFKAAWRKVCFNQFHDILCGCSIMEAYEDVKESAGYALTVAADAENNAHLRLGLDIDTWIDGVSDSVRCNERHYCNNKKFPRPVAVYNPTSYTVKVPVRTYHPSTKVEDCEYNPVLFQNVRSSRSNDSHKDTVFMAEVPPMGYSVYWLWHVTDDNAVNEYYGTTDIASSDCGVIRIENSKISVEFSKKTGAIASLKCKASGEEFVSCENFALPTVFNNEKPDTWAHNIFKFDEVLGTMKLRSIELTECGKLRSVVKAIFDYNNSTLNQEYILYSDSDCIRVKSKAIWQEPLVILKIPFGVEGENPVSTYEIPGGFIKRPCNGEEEPALLWGDISAGHDGARKGVSVISDSKYSYSCPDNELRLTVIRNSIFADHYSDRPAANFNYCDEGLQRFEYLICPHFGDVCPSSMTEKGEVFINSPVTVPLGYHKGTLPLKKSFLQVDKKNILVTAVKLCEDGSGDGIIRCRETEGKRTVAIINCDMFNCSFRSDFRANEIKTFRIDAEGFVSETNFLEGIPED